MKVWMCVFLIVVAGICRAGEAVPPRVYGFEQTELGQFPNGMFHSLWGGFGRGAFVYVTNLQASEGEKSLVFNLMPNSAMGGMGLPLSKGLKRGIVTVAFDYYREKFGTLNFEFRSREGKWPFFTLGERLVLRRKTYHGNGSPGAFKPYVWHRVTFTYPLTKEDAPQATITVKNLATGETFGGAWDDWTMEDPALSSSLFFNFHNATPSRQVMYIDNLSVKTTRGDK